MNELIDRVGSPLLTRGSVKMFLSASGSENRTGNRVSTRNPNLLTCRYISDLTQTRALEFWRNVFTHSEPTAACGYLEKWVGFYRLEGKVIRNRRPIRVQKVPR